MSDAVFDYKKLRYLLKIARIQYEEREWLASFDDRMISKGLRKNEILEEIHDMRETIKTDAKRSFRQKNSGKIYEGILKIFFGDDLSAFRKFNLTIGGSPTAERKIGKHYKITVGYMWHYKVWNTLYTGDHDFGPWVILSAEKVRVNSKLVTLYEVKAFNKNTGECSNGYVAQSKTEKRHTAFAKTAALAARRAEQMISDDLDAIFKGEKHD